MLRRVYFRSGMVFAWACGTTAAVIVIGGLVVLYFGSEIGPFDAIFQAVSAFGNSGLYIGRLPGGNSLPTHLLLLPLAVLGGLGLPVLMELADLLRSRTPLSSHSQTTLTWTAGIYLAALTLLVILQWPGQSAPVGQWRQTLVTASQQAAQLAIRGLSLWRNQQSADSMDHDRPDDHRRRLRRHRRWNQSNHACCSDWRNTQSARRANSRPGAGNRDRLAHLLHRHARRGIPRAACYRAGNPRG